MIPTTFTLDFEPEASESTGELFNEDRASMVGQLVTAFERCYYGGDGYGEEDTTVIRDIITNLCHLLRRMGADPEEEVEAATWMWREEEKIEAEDQEEQALV